MRKHNQRFNPHDLVSISAPKKSDVRAAPIPEIPDAIVGRNMQFTTVIEEWQNTVRSLAILTTEEWTNNVPPSLVKITTEEWKNTPLSSGLVIEEWVNNPPELEAQTTEEWQNEPPSLQLKTTETMTGNFLNSPFYVITGATAVVDLKGSGGASIDAIGQRVNASCFDSKVEILQATFKLRRVGSPTGSLILRHRSALNGIKNTGSTLDISTVSTSATDYSFNTLFGAVWFIEVGDHVTLEYTGGTSTDYVEVSITGSQFGAMSMTTHSVSGGWLDDTVNGVYGSWA